MSKTNDDICHSWANKSHSQLNTKNLYHFAGEIYSYGDHYLAAKHFPKYDDVVLINCDRYSPSTGQHLSKIRSASSHLKSFTVPNPSDCKDIKNLEYLVDMSESLIQRASRARKDNRAYYLESAQSYYNKAIDYKKTFKIRNKIKVLDFSDLGLETVKAELKAKSEKLKAENKLLKAQELKEKSEKIRAWRALESDRISLRYNEGALLRVKGDVIQTSEGANVPLKDAVRLCKYLKNNDDVIDFRIGHYNVKSYSNGNLVINCHTIEKSEIELMINQLLINEVV